MVVNYSLLPHYNIQMHHPLAIYQEWQNMRDCMWNNIKELGTARYHIIPYKIPTYIPDKASFLRFYEEMTITGLKQFHEKDTEEYGYECSLSIYGLLTFTSDSCRHR